MPGMTAFVTIVISERDNVWKTANAAFLVRSFENFMDPADINGATPASHMAILRDGNVVMIPYSKGLSTATETEIMTDEIQMGDKVIVSRMGQKTSTKTNNQMRPMGGGRPRM